MNTQSGALNAEVAHVTVEHLPLAGRRALVIGIAKSRIYEYRS